MKPYLPKGYKMKIVNIAISSHIVLLFLIPLVASTSSSTSLTTFVQCLTNHSSPPNPVFNGGIYTQNSPSFPKALQFYERNLRFNFSSSSTPKPLAIITAMNASDVQATVSCCKTLGLLLKIRSGGHDYDGLSYLSNVPYIVLDLYNLRSINIDTEKETAWVESGATLGELYYKIAKTSSAKGFPAGVCPTVGTGGHFSGGGYGNMQRKFGLTVDNIIDAQIVDANGKILDRKTMGEDLFWAIRGGGGASFAVILSWKIKLVTIPDKVTVFKVVRTLEQGTSDLVYKWQTISTKLPKEIFIRLVMDVVKGAKTGEKKMRLTHWAMFLGNAESLLSLMNTSFPELGIVKSDCIEMSWLESVVFWAEFPKGTSVEVVLKRTEYVPTAFKIKSDYVYQPIPIPDLENIWKKMIEEENVIMKFNPYGGKMGETGVSETPYPHRNALFKIQYLINWKGDSVAENNLELARRYYDFMVPYASKSPREAFLNYRDIDIGSSPYCNATLEEAKLYGVKYFKGNFDRLVEVKSKVDPSNFFRNEQSIPILP